MIHSTQSSDPSQVKCGPDKPLPERGRYRNAGCLVRCLPYSSCLVGHRSAAGWSRQRVAIISTSYTYFNELEIMLLPQPRAALLERRSERVLRTAELPFWGGGLFCKCRNPTNPLIAFHTAENKFRT